jgi:hypothetical protein
MNQPGGGERGVAPAAAEQRLLQRSLHQRRRRRGHPPVEDPARADVGDEGVGDKPHVSPHVGGGWGRGAVPCFRPRPFPWPALRTGRARLRGSGSRRGSCRRTPLAAGDQGGAAYPPPWLGHRPRRSGCGAKAATFVTPSERTHSPDNPPRFARRRPGISPLSRAFGGSAPRRCRASPCGSSPAAPRVLPVRRPEPKTPAAPRRAFRIHCRGHARRTTHPSLVTSTPHSHDASSLATGTADRWASPRVVAPTTADFPVGGTLVSPPGAQPDGGESRAGETRRPLMRCRCARVLTSHDGSVSLPRVRSTW